MYYGVRSQLSLVTNIDNYDDIYINDLSGINQLSIQKNSKPNKLK